MRLLASGQTTVADTTDGYSVVLSPNNYTFQGTTDSVSGTQSVTATVTAHRGEDAVTADINASSITVPSGFTVTNVGTSPSATITITANNTVTNNGGFTVPVVVHDGTDNINFNLKFSYSIAFTGSDGRGVSSITDQYCLSTSQSSAIGNWVNELPAYQTGRYYWTRQHIVYSDGSDEYTDAVYDGALTTANGNAYDAAQAAAAAQTQAGRAETAANNAVASAGRAETAATTAEANAAQAIQDAADAKTASTSAQADAADAKTAAQNAQSDAADAASAAQAAQGSAATAASSASAAQTSAQNAEASAQSAQDDADAASTSASQAATSAQNAISSAQAAETAANEAKADAADAKTAAGEAKREAATATRAANGALTQLSTVEDVVDVLNWIQQHGTYTKSTDTEVVAGKYYFTRSGTSPNYNYTLVNNPTGNPSTNNYYECTGVDEAVTNYVTTHLALTNDGLYVVKDNQGYKLKLGADGAYVIDPTGQVVATYGESIFFDSDRPQRIGNNNVYLEYYDSDNDTVADALRIVGANITLQSGQTVEQSVGAVQSDLDSYKQTNNAAVQGNATDLANYISSNNSALEALQTQIDGAIETWFYEVDPTTSNPPASSWDTDDKKKTHLGDLYYNTATGHVFRWQKSGSTYSWTEIQDIDATKALADAAKAQTTANNKRRVFVTTPTPPYDVGDLWVGGSNGDIKRCATAKADGQSYAAGDWVLASKYTDDTKANAVETALNNYKTTVSNTYVTNTTFETRADAIEGQVSSVETTTKAYADDLIEQEVIDRNAAIKASSDAITLAVEQVQTNLDTFINPIAEKEYTDVVISANNDQAGWLYFASVKPINYYTPWRIKYKVYSSIDDLNDGNQYSEVMIEGAKNTYYSYQVYNMISNTAYRPIYGHVLYTLNDVGVQSGYGHLFGIRFQYAYWPDLTYSRTIKIEVIEAENCTPTLFDSMSVYTNITGYGSTNYYARYAFDGTTQGYSQSGDRNETNTVINNFYSRTGAVGFWAMSLVMRDGQGTYQGICTAADGTVTSGNRTTATTKKANTNGFEVGTSIYLFPWNTVAANTNFNLIGYASFGALDSRYSINSTLTTGFLTIAKPIYLVGTVNSNDGLYYLDSTWWTQTPTTDGKVYVLIGIVYDSTTSSCRFNLFEQNRWYICVDGKLVDYNTAYTNAQIKVTSDSINLEVSKKVGNNEVISRINQSAESVTIDADKININGVITAGSIAKTADLPTKVSDLTNDSNYQTASDVTTTLSPYAKTADISNTYATKSTANLREQRIYITKASGTNSVSANTTWVTSTSDSQNAWTTKRPTYDRNYPVLFTAIQSQTVAQSGQTSCNCTTPIKDDTLTIIDGGHIITGTIDADKIAANAITANKLATDAIKSNNYQASQNASSPYSATGTFLDLSNGRLYMPNFGVDADGKAYINGEIIATSGKIGEDSTSYWEIGTQTDYNNDDSAALIGHGTSFIQTGDFQLSNGLLNTRSYTANHQITYPKYNNTYWDFGVQAPTLDTSTSGYVAGIDDNFFYIRNHESTIPSLKTDWNYLYRVDKNGNIYTTGQVYINGQSLDQLYASISDVDSSFLPTTGGTINGNLTVTGSINGTATKATQLTHTLSINNKTWDGSSNMDVGTLGVAYGGTGGTTFTSGAALIGNGQGAFQTRAITNNTSANYISGSTNLITANTLKFWNGAYDSSHTSNLEYVKQGKLGTVVTHDLEDFITTEGGIIDGSLTVTDLNAGSLVVTVAARFTNAIYGDLTGNADTADKVNHDLIIKLNSGTTEGTNMFTFDGSAAKTVNVTKSAIGLGNVENTALSTWAGSANLTTTKVGTLAAAAAKGVDSSIAAASTSANLPTSAAVATFVEGKGYVTSSGVTSVRVQATSPVVSSVNTAQTATLNTTISLADGYGDTKNPYASKTKSYVLAAPSDANGVPTFRALVADDIPTLTPSKVGLGNVTNNKQVKGLSSGTTNGHLVTWGADGYTVADSGIAKGSVATKLTLAGTDYSASSNAITVTQANLQSAVQSTGLVLMTSAERSKLSSIQVSEGGTIDFSGVTASSPLTATVATDKKVNITHNTSGVTAGTYRSVTVNTYGHVTGGTNPTTLSGYGITDAKIASGVITLGSNTITPLTASSTLDATKLSGTASISTTGNAGTATKFSSSRTIALTGDVTGSASGDGSSGWSVATTVKDDSHNHTTQTFIPISTKTYTNITVTGNSNPAGWLYFAKMIPVNNDYGKHAYVKYRLKSTMAGLSGNLGHEETDMEIMMYNNALLWYKVKNNISNTSYRPFYNHLIYRAKQAGITGGYGHLLGVRLQSSYDPTNSTYARTFEIEILETRNCSITFFDSMILYANAPGTGSTNYDGITELNGTTQGDTHTGDANDTTTTVYSTPRITATTTPLMQNSLIMQDSTGAWQSICVGTAGTGTAKTKNTAGFVLGQIYYFSSGTIAVGNQSSTGVIRNNQDWVDFRYTSNCASTLTKYAPIYIVGTMNNGLFYLDDIWWTQTTPTSNDGRVYIPVGMAYDTPYYSFWGWKGAYYHDGTGLRPYVEASIASDYVRLDGTSKMTGNLTIRKIGTGANNWASRRDNPSLIFEATDNQSAGFVFTQHDSVQAPSSVTLVGNSPGPYFIAPNIKALDSFYGDLSGNASTATKATQDGDGHTITSTYVNLTGAQTISGTKTFSAMPVASAGLCVGNSGTAGGLSLWSDKDVKRYGLALRSASDSGKHGYVQGGYATYNYMYSADDTGVYTRGWIFKDSVHDKGVASISGAGNAVFNGSVTVGGNAANTSGWRLEKDENLDCLNFIFVA